MKNWLCASVMGCVSVSAFAEMPYKIEYPEQAIVPITKIQVLRSQPGKPSTLEVYTAVIDVREKGKDYQIQHFQETIQAEDFEPSLDVPKLYPAKTVVPISKTEITQTRMRGTETRESETRQIEAMGVEVYADQSYAVKEFKMGQATEFGVKGGKASVTHVETKTNGYPDQDILIIKDVPDEE